MLHATVSLIDPSVCGQPMPIARGLEFGRGPQEPSWPTPSQAGWSPSCALPHLRKLQLGIDDVSRLCVDVMTARPRAMLASARALAVAPGTLAIVMKGLSKGDQG